MIDPRPDMNDYDMPPPPACDDEGCEEQPNVNGCLACNRQWCAEHIPWRVEENGLCSPCWVAATGPNP